MTTMYNNPIMQALLSLLRDKETKVYNIIWKDIFNPDVLLTV